MVMMAEGGGSNISSQPYPIARDWKVQRKVNKKRREGQNKNRKIDERGR